MWLFKWWYRKYPKLVACWANRYIKYNQAVEDIIQLNEKQEIFVIRPSKTIEISRLEKDSTKVQEMYDLGVKDAKNAMEKLKVYLAKSKC